MAVMSDARTVSKHPQHRTDLYKAFRSLDPERRRSIALRILRDEKVLADLYDHFLIREAMREHGRSTPWRSYLNSDTTSSR